MASSPLGIPSSASDAAPDAATAAPLGESDSRGRRIAGAAREAFGEGVSKLGTGIGTIGEGVTKLGEMSRIPVVSFASAARRRRNRVPWPP